MNWQEIYEKYPRSWNKLALRFLIRIYDGRLVDVGCEVDNPKLMCNFNLRNLYDFFDEQEIIIQIGYWADDLEYWFDIYKPLMQSGCCLVNEDGFTTRTEAEEQAFLQAFKILEERL